MLIEEGANLRRLSRSETREWRLDDFEASVVKYVGSLEPPASRDCDDTSLRLRGRDFSAYVGGAKASSYGCSLVTAAERRCIRAEPVGATALQRPGRDSSTGRGSMRMNDPD